MAPWQTGSLPGHPGLSPRQLAPVGEHRDVVGEAMLQFRRRSGDHGEILVASVLEEVAAVVGIVEPEEGPAVRGGPSVQLIAGVYGDFAGAGAGAEKEPLHLFGGGESRRMSTVGGGVQVTPATLEPWRGPAPHAGQVRHDLRGERVQRHGADGDGAAVFAGRTRGLDDERAPVAHDSRVYADDLGLPRTVQAFDLDADLRFEKRAERRVQLFVVNTQQPPHGGFATFPVDVDGFGELVPVGQRVGQTVAAVRFQREGERVRVELPAT